MRGEVRSDVGAPHAQRTDEGGDAMGLVSAAVGAVGGTLRDQWRDFFVAPTFDEQTIVAPGILQESNRGRGSNRSSSANVITDGSRVVVPENTAVIITDGGGIASLSTLPGYFVFRNDGQPSIFNGSGLRESLIRQSWKRFKFGGQPSKQQLIYYINLREIRNLRFGTPGPLPYKDFSLVPEGSGQAPVLRLRARGQYSVRVVDPFGSSETSFRRTPSTTPSRTRPAAANCVRNSSQRSRPPCSLCPARPTSHRSRRTARSWPLP